MENRSRAGNSGARRVHLAMRDDRRRVHPELVGMLYAKLESGRSVAWLRLRIPGRSNPESLQKV